ncbi:12855_t:CDS:2 [Acaulospora colombiana]|uniref:12855_t:CDS:1 n=1 Tax=Acaulospora colombiana TaxID=27376 RepID=A0ACA9KVB3_9GLOM|nr:12855_t:CDS:2 [Acaulospora colombiana]
MGNNVSKIIKLRKKKSRLKPSSSNASSSFDSSYSSKTSFSEDTSSDVIETSFEDHMSAIYNALFVNLWGVEYSAPVDDILTTTGKVLEAGLVYPMPEYTGVDLNPVAPNNYPPNVNVIKGDLLSLPYDENQFDFTRISTFSPEFTDNEWVQGISEMIRVTKCGGWIELWEPKILLPKNTPTYLKFVESRKH